MKVYVVRYSLFWEYDANLGVFETRDAAIRMVEEMVSDWSNQDVIRSTEENMFGRREVEYFIDTKQGQSYSIEEWEVRKDIC